MIYLSLPFWDEYDVCSFYYWFVWKRSEAQWHSRHLFICLCAIVIVIDWWRSVSLAIHSALNAAFIGAPNLFSEISYCNLNTHNINYTFLNDRYWKCYQNLLFSEKKSINIYLTSPTKMSMLSTTKWKVLKMLPLGTNRNVEIDYNATPWEAFREKYNSWNKVLPIVRLIWMPCQVRFSDVWSCWR